MFDNAVPKANIHVKMVQLLVTVMEAEAYILLVEMIWGYLGLRTWVSNYTHIDYGK